jgi:transposase
MRLTTTLDLNGCTPATIPLFQPPPMPVNILNLPGLNVLAFKETDTEYHVQAEPVAISRLCPHCGRSNDTVKHAQKTLFVRDLPAHGKAVAIHLNVPRLLCKPCGQTFTAAVPEVDSTRQMTERLAKWIGRQALEYPYIEVARQTGVDEKTIRNVFNDYVAVLEKTYRRETPVWLGIDEIKLGWFRAIFTNIQGLTLVEMLPDRYYTSIVRFLESLPDKDRITHCATDMWRPYKLAVLRVLPNAKLVVDKFHVVSKANASFDAVRRSIGKADQKKHGAGLKKAHKLFAKRATDLTDEQYLTVSGWLNCFPLLATAYDLKERLYAVYEVETKEDAWAAYLDWEASIPAELTKPFKPVQTAFRNWKEYILNHFDDERITNAFTESFNAKVRKVYRDGRGYTFERLRAKVLYTDRLQKRVSVQEVVKVKRKPRFEEVYTTRMHLMTVNDVAGDYENRVRARTGTLGTDLSTLEAVLDAGKF